MRIGLYNGSTLYPLAGAAGVDERTHSSAADFSIASNIQLQTAQKTRAANAAHFDRLNLVTAVAFSSTRLFATRALAEQYALDYDLAAPRTGILYLTTVGDDGTTLVTRYLQNAVVSPPTRKVMGCTVFLTYSVTGGSITTS